MVDASAADPEMLNFLQTLGLKPADRVIDYGCGALRFGAAVIGFLDPERYHGMDIDAAFYRPGVSALGESVVAKKRPTFATISPVTLAAAARLGAGYIASWQVIPVIPPSEEASYFRSIVGLMDEGTVIAADFFETPEVKRLSPMAWGKTRDSVRAAITAAAPGLAIEFADSPVVLSEKHKHSILTIRR
jgi:hypothetical protein